MPLESSTIEKLAEALKEARANNRQIVPIVGAGLSADCGFPVITAIVRYFGKLYQYIDHWGPIVRSDDIQFAFLKKRFDDYRKEPWQFVQHFGWPDRFQLNQDLFTQLRDSSSGEESPLIEASVRKGLDDLLPNLNPPGFWAFDSLQNDITKELPEELAQKALHRFKEKSSKSTPFDVLGDWRRLILHFTNFQSDYADALFARFGATRRPGQGHQFLAFLVKHLAVPTIFTFNFDSLIEQALQSEGMRARIFAMEHGTGLPHPRLIRDPLAVIKMHGSTHALLVDEQLDRPLTKDYLRRFERLTRANPLLLVVGCSDGDRRLRDLVSHVVSDSVKSESSRSPSVLWLHYEHKSPNFLDELPRAQAGQEEKVLVCPTNNPGATLLHLYSWLSNCSPAARVPYLAHVQQPVHLGKNRVKHSLQKVRYELVSSGFKNNPMPTASHELLKTANYWALNGYQFIWIDLEAVHTFAGVVGSIIDQCRKFDPDLAPSVLPVNIESIEGDFEDLDFINRIISLAANRVARALRRTRYYLAFDGLETYAWPATTHHGVTHKALERGAAARLRNLVDFLLKLKGKPEDKGEWLGESLIGVSVDDPKARYSGYDGSDDLSKYISVEEQCGRLTGYELRSLESSHFRFEDTFEELREDLPLGSLKSIPDEVLHILKGNNPGELADLESKARLAFVLLNLSFFRRTRPLVAMRHLLEPLLPSGGKNGKSPDNLLVAFTQRLGENDYRLLRQLEGGGFWFNHTIRDTLYAKNTRYANTQHVKNCLGDELEIEKRARSYQNSAFQLFLSAMTHQRIARTWYTRTFVQSQDTFAFLEYTYHQISSTRNLVKLRRLTQVALELLSSDQEKGKAIAQALRKGIANCGELVSLMGPDDLFRQLEFMGAENFRKDFCEELDCEGTALIAKTRNLEEALAQRHGGELHDLYRAWTRAEVTLRTQVAAEQLLHWCDELLSDDLELRCNRVVTGYLRDNPWEKGDSTPPRFTAEYHKMLKGENEDQADLIDCALEEGVIAKFRRYLQDLRVKLWIERSDYQTCMTQRRQQLRGRPKADSKTEVANNESVIQVRQNAGAETKNEPENDESFIKSCDVLQCHQLLDIVDSKLKLRQESSFNDTELIKGRKEALWTLDKIEGQLKVHDRLLKKPHDELLKKNEHDGLPIPGTALIDQAADFPQAQADLNEAWLRLLHLRTECQLGRVSMFSHDGFTGDPNDWRPRVVDLEEAKKSIKDGLRQISARDAHTRYAPRSVVVDPTADGALYLQYRSVFYLLNGRARWLDMQDNFEKAFDAALWSFEMARGGLGDDGPLMSALIELYTVEALLARGRCALFNEIVDGGVDLALGWYESAHGGLQRAYESLLASRRNVIWRKFYFRLLTQYHSDQLLLDYAIMEKRAEEGKNQPEKRRKADLAEQEREKERFWQEKSRSSLIRLRGAYQSLLTALDLYLPAAEKVEGFPHRYRWLYRMWWELTLCGYATGRLALEALNPSIDINKADSYICDQMKWLNKMDGIQDSELGKFMGLGKLIKPPQFEFLQQAYAEVQEIGILDDKLFRSTALLRRCKIIEQAMLKSNEDLLAPRTGLESPQ
jgi:NAD-dependent SIR2 family protein deacetylase